MRALGGVLFGLGGAALVLAVMAITRIWDEQADSPNSTYIEVGGLWLVVALGLFAAGLIAWRRR